MVSSSKITLTDTELFVSTKHQKSWTFTSLRVMALLAVLVNQQPRLSFQQLLTQFMLHLVSACVRSLHYQRTSQLANVTLYSDPEACFWIREYWKPPVVLGVFL